MTVYIYCTTTKSYSAVKSHLTCCDWTPVSKIFSRSPNMQIGGVANADTQTTDDDLVDIAPEDKIRQQGNGVRTWFCQI